MKIHPVTFNHLLTKISSLKNEHTQPHVYNVFVNDEKRLDENVQEYVNIIKNLSKDELTILDFGGGAGGHYKTLRENIPNKKLIYNIVENPKLLDRFIEHMADYENVNYCGSINDFKEVHFDFVYANASPQMLSPKRAVDIIKDLFSVGGEYVLLQRIIVSEGNVYDNFFTIANVGHGEQYFSITSDKHVLELGEVFGYDLKYSEYQRPQPVQFKMKKDYNSDVGVICYKNYLFKKKYE